MRTSLVFIAVIAALGCASRRGASDAGPGQDSAVDMTPVDPPPARDSGTIDAAIDAAADAAEPAPPPNFVLECDDDAPAEPPSDPLAVWTAEREAHGALGRAATFDLQGMSYRVQGAGAADVAAPFTLHTGEIGSGLVTFADARVEGIEERGSLALLAGGLSSNIPNEAPASAGSIDGLPLATLAVENGMLDGTLALTTERRGNSDYYHATASVSELALGGIYQAYLTPEGSIGGDGRVEWVPSEPVLIHEASSLTFNEEGVGSVTKALAEPFDAEYQAFAVAGDFTGGSLEVTGLQVRGTPVAVFGQAGALRAHTSSIESVDGFRLTQAVNEAGLVVPATVEIVPESRSVWVRPSESRVIRLHYRERSYLGDAVLGEIQIGGAARDLLELQTRFVLPDTLTEDLIDAVIDTGWAAPLAAITTLPAVPIVFVIDLFACFFGGCLDQPAPLDPFPQWIDAGAIGTMEVRINGDLPAGSYETTLTFVGRNYCPVTVPLTIHIGDQPPADADGGTE